MSTTAAFARTLFGACAETCVAGVHAVGAVFFGYVFVFSPIIVALRTGRDDHYAANLFVTRVFASCVCFACASGVLHRTFWPMSDTARMRTETCAHCGVALAIAGTGVPLALLTLRPAMAAVYLCWLASACAAARTTFVLARRTMPVERRVIETLYVACVVPLVGAFGVVVHGVSVFLVSTMYLPFLAVACAHVVAAVIIVRQKSPGVLRVVAHAVALAATFAHWLFFFYSM